VNSSLDFNFYLELNKSYGGTTLYNPMPYGFFSIVNNTISAILYGLISRKTIILDQQLLPGGWNAYFDASLPGMEVTGGVMPEEAIDGWSLIRWVEDLLARNETISLPDLNIKGDLLSIQRGLVSLLCGRSTSLYHDKWRRRHEAQWELGLGERDYVACHVRQGDKIIGTPYRTPDGKWGVLTEGEFIPVRTYLRNIRKIAPDIRKIFVMTDDYAVIEEFRLLAKGYSIHSFCTPGQNGYHQADFNKKSQDERRAAFLSLMEEVEIAAASHAFFGCYRSNVSRFILLKHFNPDLCFSMDSTKRWFPAWPFKLESTV